MPDRKISLVIAKAGFERFVAAAHAYCTLGEICGVLREEFGEYKEPKTL